MTVFQEGETVLGSWVAALPIGSLDLSLLGGDLVLTDRRLVFVPVMNAVFGFAGHALGHGEIHRADAVGPLRLRLAMRAGGRRDYLVLASRWSAVWDTDNTPARDHAWARIDEVLARA
ncbi:hypothetical protein NGM33_06505 [Nocardiopsis dassonvillei]|jgi:hypothetical protein|uniref:hypothetical protein n=1 Tax=Nocardiopsis dassonvillei TaxID=2014 RepID=UPI0020A2BD28|nr:hypothetical protein [Nocardiopsis dassonvillei]MCP3012979.1 hypothetical protein [Nocardiopsis dassonvillei]